MVNLTDSRPPLASPCKGTGYQQDGLRAAGLNLHRTEGVALALLFQKELQTELCPPSPRVDPHCGCVYR